MYSACGPSQSMSMTHANEPLNLSHRTRNRRIPYTASVNTRSLAHRPDRSAYNPGNTGELTAPTNHSASDAASPTRCTARARRRLPYSNRRLYMQFGRGSNSPDNNRRKYSPRRDNTPTVIQTFSVCRPRRKRLLN